MPKAARLGSVQFLVSMLIAPTLLGIAPTALAVDPNHDIVGVAVRVDAANLYFDVTVAGTVQPSVRAANEFRVFFSIVSPTTASAGAPARSYMVSNGSSNDVTGWFIFNEVAGSGVLGS
ncbi:MAG: hypothetical protein ACT4PT_12470, partial [Methanobacteriota archaeon]